MRFWTLYGGVQSGNTGYLMKVENQNSKVVSPYSQNTEQKDSKTLIQRKLQLIIPLCGFVAAKIPFILHVVIISIVDIKIFITATVKFVSQM